MLCHKDKTFCVAECRWNKAESDCYNALERERASLTTPWGLPVSQADFSRECKDYEFEQRPA